MSIMSDEVNFLVYRYLQESGYQHSAFAFGLESHIAQSNISGSLVPPGALINILQKGVQYIEAELCINDDGSLIDDLENIEPIPLIDAVIPEALAARAANILRSAAHSVEAARNLALTAVDAMDIDPQTVSTAEPGALTLSGHEGEVFSCSWNPSSNTLATGGADGTARLWPIADSPDSKTVQSVTLDHQLSTDNFKAMTKDITAVDWNSDGSMLATAAIDCQTRIWNSEGQSVAVLPGHRGLIFTLKWNKKGSYLLSASLDKVLVRLWNYFQDGKISFVDFGLSGRLHVEDRLTKGQRSIVWDTNSWEIKQTFDCHQGPVVDIDWQSNSCFASCSTDKQIQVCKIGLDKPVKTFSGHTDEVNCVRWDPSGTVLASASDDKLIKIWNLKQDTSLQEMIGHTKEVTLVEWCPTAPNVIASACYDATVRLWNVDQCACLFTFSRHLEPVNSISFSPDGKYLASATLDGLMNIWSSQNGNCVHTHRGSVGVFEVRWSPDGNKIALCQADRLVKVIDARKMVPS